MTTVRELIKHLADFGKLCPENADAEIMFAYDGDVAFEFSRADKVVATDAGDISDVFLVLTPNVLGKRLKFNVRSVN